MVQGTLVASVLDAGAVPISSLASASVLEVGAVPNSSSSPSISDAWSDADWSFTRRRAPSLSALTAACIAGEARTIVYPSVHERLRLGELTPLQADAFLVLSLTESTSWLANSGIKNDDLLVTSANIQPAVTHLDPVSTKLTTARELYLSAPSAWRHCFCDEVENAASCDKGPPGPPGVKGVARGVCSPQPTLALSWRGCLTMIAAAEAERGSRYPLVLRARPDVLALRRFAPVTLQWPTAFGAFSSDFRALMTRSVADVSLRQFPLASGVDACWDSTWRFQRETCNPCMLQAYGIAIVTWRSEDVLVRPCAPKGQNCTGTNRSVDICAVCRDGDPLHPTGFDDERVALRDLEGPLPVTLDTELSGQFRCSAVNTSS